MLIIIILIVLSILVGLITLVIGFWVGQMYMIELLYQSKPDEAWDLLDIYDDISENGDWRSKWMGDLSDIMADKFAEEERG